MSGDQTSRRPFLDKEHPAAYRALNGAALKVKAVAEQAGMDRRLVELINLRVSQLNGCAFCLDLHTGISLEAGESPQRLAVLSAWRDTELFSERERAALAVAETVTELPDLHAQDREYAEARQVLSDEEFSAVCWVAITMNAFNRVSIVSRHPVRPHRPVTEPSP